MNGIRTTLLLASLTGLMLLIGGALGGRGSMMIALLFSLVMNMGTYWYRDKIVLRMYHAKEVTPVESPELHGIVRGLVDRANMPMPKVYTVETPMPNAFATGRSPEHAVVAKWIKNETYCGWRCVTYLFTKYTPIKRNLGEPSVVSGGGVGLSQITF